MAPLAQPSPAGPLGDGHLATVRELAQALQLALAPDTEKLLAEQLRAILLEFQASANALELPGAAPAGASADAPGGAPGQAADNAEETRARPDGPGRCEHHSAALRPDRARLSSLAGAILAQAARREDDYFTAAPSIPSSPVGGERAS